MSSARTSIEQHGKKGLKKAYRNDIINYNISRRKNMSYSLLAHLYPHIKGSQEDIATFSLQYLLLQSNELNRAFTKRISNIMEIETDETLQYVCQSTGKSEEKERPDMSALDSNGNEVILCEMKFYATLTINQPLTYLDRLKENDGKGLIFVCPEARLTNLWYKLKELCSQRNIEEINRYCVKVDDIKLATITWTEIIELLKQVASSTAVEFSADVKQLEGYCNQLDSEAFIPFIAEDLSAEMANKAERYYQVLDEAIELICADKSIKTSKKGLKATAYRKGYTRSLFIDDNFTITLNYDRDMWKNPATVETPFWVAIRDNEWDQPESFLGICKSFPEQHKELFWGLVFLALEPLQEATFAEVCEDIKNKIIEYIDCFR